MSAEIQEVIAIETPPVLPPFDVHGSTNVAGGRTPGATARVQGAPLTQMPRDLYIPPDALEVILETFEGPLDLLLYLIKRQNLDILDIPIAQVTHQYMDYIDLMKGGPLELTAEYLLMAAMLAEIKSRMLLPRPPDLAEEDDPRAELVRRLQEYERYKQAAEDMDNLPQLDRDVFHAGVQAPDGRLQRLPPTVNLSDILLAFKEVLARAEMFTHHHIQREPLSVRERMAQVLTLLQADSYTEFTTLFGVEEGRRGLVVTLLALLELIKESLIELVQNEAFGPIHVKSAGARFTEVTS